MWRIGGSCALPLGAMATVEGARIEMLAVVIAPDGSRVARVEVVSDSPEGAAALATKELIAEGAEEILEALDRRPSEAARRPDRPGDATGRPVRRARPAAAPPGSHGASWRRRIEIVPARSAPLTAALRDLSAGRFAWITLTSRATVEMTGVAAGLPSRPSARRWPRSARARARRSAPGRGGGPTSCPATFTTAGSGARLPARRQGACSARAPTSPRRASRMRSPRRAGRPSASTPTGRRLARSLPADARAALRDGGVDAITFTSASTVRGFVGAMGVVRGNPKVVEHRSGHGGARRGTHGLRVSAVARPHTIEGLVAAARTGPGRGRR